MVMNPLPNDRAPKSEKEEICCYNKNSISKDKCRR